jgi:hypothetical protein
MRFEIITKLNTETAVFWVGKICSLIFQKNVASIFRVEDSGSEVGGRR